MSQKDAALMEASLLAVADAGIDIRHALFERFFAAFPDRRASFLVVDASSRRMTDETLQMMFGLARGESWVWGGRTRPHPPRLWAAADRRI